MPTAQVALDLTQYVQINTGQHPMLLQAPRDAVRIVYSAGQPTLSNTSFHVVGGVTNDDVMPIPYNDTNVWALATSQRSSLVVTEYTGVSGGGGGGIDPVGIKNSSQVQIDPATEQKQDAIIAALGGGNNATPDSGNTYTYTSADGTTEFAGTAYDCRNPDNLSEWRIAAQQIVLSSNVASGLGGTFVFEYGPDGSTWVISESRTITSFETVRDFPLQNAGNFFRVRFTPDRALTGGESIFITTTQWYIAPPDFVRLADQRIERDNAAAGRTFAFIQGFDDDGLSRNVPLDQRGRLKVNTPGTIATFGDAIVSNRREQISVNFSQEIPETVVSTTLTGTATATNAAAQAIVATGVGTGSTGLMESRRSVKYSPSHEIYCYFTATFSAPDANGTQLIGLFDDDNGFAIGYVGTDFVFRRIDGGVNNDTLFDDFNGSTDSQFTRDGALEAVNFQLGNVFRIRFGWLGNAPIQLEILTPDGELIPLHRIRYPNSSTAAHIENPDLPMRAYVDNGAGTANLSIATSSWAAGTTLAPQAMDTLFQKRSPIDDPLPSGSAVTIDPVLNTEPNVFDSGWLSVTDDWPGGQFLNIKTSVSANVYIMNASDRLGSNIEGDGLPQLVTVAGFPAPAGAPFFDDYFRIVIENVSGSSMTDFTIRSQGMQTPPAAIYRGLDQPVFTFFPAALTQTAIRAQNEATSLVNLVAASLDDALFVAIANRLSEVKGRVHVQKSATISGTTLPLELLVHTVTSGFKFWMTDIEIVVTTTISAGGFTSVKDGGAGGSIQRRYALVPGTNQTNGVTVLTSNYAEHIEFSTDVHLSSPAIGTGGAITININGYEEPL